MREVKAGCRQRSGWIQGEYFGGGPRLRPDRSIQTKKEGEVVGKLLRGLFLSKGHKRKTLGGGGDCLSQGLLLESLSGT